MKDICLNCGKEHNSKLWGAECDCKKPNVVHQMKNGFNTDDKTKEIIKNGGFINDDETTTISIFKNEENLYTLKVLHYGYGFYEKQDFRNRKEAINAIPHAFTTIECL